MPIFTRYRERYEEPYAEVARLRAAVRAQAASREGQAAWAKGRPLPLVRQ
jgi:hypothetical protein